MGPEEKPPRQRGNAISRWIAAGIPAERAKPQQLDLFPDIPSLKPRPGRPRTARIVARGSNRRGYRRE
jgi:hypothetical protein